MILFGLAALCLISVPLTGGKLSRLAKLQLRWLWTAPLALVPARVGCLSGRGARICPTTKGAIQRDSKRRDTFSERSVLSNRGQPALRAVHRG